MKKRSNKSPIKILELTLAPFTLIFKTIENIYSSIDNIFLDEKFRKLDKKTEETLEDIKEKIEIKSYNDTPQKFLANQISQFPSWLNQMIRDDKDLIIKTNQLRKINISLIGGYFNGLGQTISLDMYSDESTFRHEVGHYLHVNSDDIEMSAPWTEAMKQRKWNIDSFLTQSSLELKFRFVFYQKAHYNEEAFAVVTDKYLELIKEYGEINNHIVNRKLEEKYPILGSAYVNNILPEMQAASQFIDLNKKLSTLNPTLVENTNILIIDLDHLSEKEKNHFYKLIDIGIEFDLEILGNKAFLLINDSTFQEVTESIKDMNKISIIEAKVPPKLLTKALYIKIDSLESDNLDLLSEFIESGLDLREYQHPPKKDNEVNLTNKEELIEPHKKLKNQRINVLRIAIEKCFINITNKLLESAGEIKETAQNDITPLISEVIRWQEREIDKETIFNTVKLLKDKGANLDDHSLAAAAQQQNLEVLDYLLSEAGLNINSSNSNPINLVIQRYKGDDFSEEKRIEMINKLIDRGAELDHTNILTAIKSDFKKLTSHLKKTYVEQKGYCRNSSTQIRA